MYSLIKSERKTGNETFSSKGEPLPLNVKSYWQWGASNLIDNVWRGVLAEYIVATALDCDSGARVEWDAYDLTTNDGIRIEVKSSAYIQSWEQLKLSAIKFGIAPTYLDIAVAPNQTHKQRHSDVYVFCVLAHKQQDTLNPLNLDQWDFYVLSTKVLDNKIPTQKTITLSSLLKLEPIECGYDGLKQAVDSATKH